VSEPAWREAHKQCTPGTHLLPNIAHTGQKQLTTPWPFSAAEPHLGLVRQEREQHGVNLGGDLNIPLCLGVVASNVSHVQSAAEAFTMAAATTTGAAACNWDAHKRMH
jgi:hypothetical protein